MENVVAGKPVLKRGAVVVCAALLGGYLISSVPQGTQARTAEEDPQHLQLQSYDAKTGEGVGGVTFQLYQLEGAVVEDGQVMDSPSSLTGFDSRWKLVDTAVTDKAGTLSFGEVEYGMYMVIEAISATEYMTSTETIQEGVAGDTRLTAHIFAVDKDRPAQLQVFEQEQIRINTAVDAVVVAGDPLEETEEAQALSSGEEMSQMAESDPVGEESKASEADQGKTEAPDVYRYDVKFNATGSNTYFDEYWVQVDLDKDLCGEGLRLSQIGIPEVVEDSDGYVDVLLKVDGSTLLPKAEGMTFCQQALHAGSLCDGTGRFVADGWCYLGRFSATDVEAIAFDNLVGSDAQVTAVALCYGAVEKGFACERPLMCTVEIPTEVSSTEAIEQVASSHGTRNWRTEAAEGKAADDAGLMGIAADAEVVTTYFRTVEEEDSDAVAKGKDGSTSGLAKTSDVMTWLIAALGAVGIAAAALVTGIKMSARRKHE